MALAMAWVARVFTVSLVMVVPGIAGVWLDGKLGTSFLSLMGFIVGLCLGMWILLVFVKSENPQG